MQRTQSTEKRRPSGKVMPRPRRVPGVVVPKGPGAAVAAPQDPQDGGGLVLTAAKVRLVYWGSAWAANAALQGQIDAAVRSVLSSGYVQALSEYRPGIGVGTLTGSQVYAAAGDPIDNFTDDDAKALLRGMMTAGLLPEPLDNQHLYMLVTPPGVTVNGILGEHWYFGYTCNDGLERNVHYGWVTGTAIDDYSCTMSHELVESITDPEMDAITFAVCPGVSGTCEIGDKCDQCYRLADGTVVQNWYSKRQHACISPA